MIIKIGQPLAFSEIGRKDQQEDRIYPTIEQLGKDDRCFVLCDGMGGHEKGEVAAAIVSETLYKSLTANPPARDVADKQWFDRSLNAAYDALDKMECGSERKPGTTMTCVYLAANGALCAHIGDSRIYVVRPGKGIIYRSEDHSLVNQLVKIGEITPEEAAHHPRRNVILRAMQPGLGKERYAADVVLVNDVKAGDYFFLCCDGILEQLSDEKLCEIISADTTPDEKLAAIYDICFGKTRDNFTCILVPVAEVEGAPADDTTVMAGAKGIDSATGATVVTPQAPVFPGSRRTGDDAQAKDVNASSSMSKPVSKPVQKNAAVQGGKAQQGGPGWLITVLVAVIVAALAFGVYYFFLREDSSKKEKQAETEQTVSDKPEANTDGKDGKNLKDQEKVEKVRDEREKIQKVQAEIKAQFNLLGSTEQNDCKKFLDKKITFDKLSKNVQGKFKGWRKKVETELPFVKKEDIDKVIADAILKPAPEADAAEDAKIAQQANNALDAAEGISGLRTNGNPRRQNR